MGLLATGAAHHLDPGDTLLVLPRRERYLLEEVLPPFAYRMLDTPERRPDALNS